jgi:hypothetical protein
MHDSANGLLRIPLPRTPVNKGPSRGNGPEFNKGTPTRSQPPSVLSLLVDYLRGSIPPSDQSLCLQHKRWLAGFAALNAVE